MTVTVGLASVTAQRHPADPRSPAAVYRDALELAVEAERLGYDSVWLSEHHVSDDGYLPSLLTFAAAVAARTQRIRIGTDVLLLPLHDPVRVAEDAAVVDLLSEGRLELGVALGWRRAEFEALGVPFEGKPARLEAGVRVLREAWAADGVVRGEPPHAYPGRASITPKPHQAGGPRLWIGGYAEPAIHRAARLGDGYLGAGSPADWREQLAQVDRGLELAGRDPAQFNLAVVVPALTLDAGDAWERVRDACHFFWWKYDDLRERPWQEGGSRLPPPLTPAGEADLRSRVVVGRPQEVAARLRDVIDAAGGRPVEVIAEGLWPGLDPGLVREAMATFAEAVAPALRAA